MRRFAFPILLGLFIALALAYSIVIPLGEAPDEVSHWAYVESIAMQSRLPTPEGAAAGEANQPPLYYWLTALATAWIPRADFAILANPDFVLDDPATPNLLLHPRREAFPYYGVALAWHWARVLSVLLGAVTVWATWRSAQEFFPDNVALPLATAAWVAFLPGWVSLAAVVNNDNLIGMLSALAIWQTLRLERTRRGCDAVWLGGLLGLAWLTKLSAAAVWGFVALALIVLAWRTRAWRQIATLAAICFGAAIVIALPWLAYNWVTYGDPLGWALYLQVGTVRPTPMNWADWQVVGWQLLTSFWGRYGGALQIHMPTPIYLGASVLAILAAGGLIGARRTPAIRRVLLWLALFGLPMLAAYLQWARMDYGAGQARRLYPMLPLLALALTAGVAQIFRAHASRAVAVWSGALGGLGIGALIFLGGVYAAPSQNLAQLPALGGAQAPSDFGQVIRVQDYRITQVRRADGVALAVEVYWQALQSPAENYWLLLQLADRNGSVAEASSVPAAGRRTTDVWRAGQAFVSTHTLIVPASVAPGRYTLRLGLHPAGVWDWLPVRDQEMLMLGVVEIARYEKGESK